MSSLDSAIRILHCLSASSPRLRVSDIAERLELPKSTVSRLLRTLSEGGLLERNAESRQYAAGSLALRLGSLYLSEHSLIGRVDDAVHRLVERYGFVGYVGVLDGANIVILRHRFGSYPVRYVVEIGTRLPAIETALGIALLGCTGAHVPGSENSGKSSHGRARMSREALSAVKRWCRERSIEIPCNSVPGISAIASAVELGPEMGPAVGFSLSFPDTAADASLRRAMAAAVARASRVLADATALDLINSEKTGLERVNPLERAEP